MSSALLALPGLLAKLPSLLSVRTIILPFGQFEFFVTNVIPGWLIASWRLIKIVSVAPLVFLLFSWKMLPESPRWLISKSRTKEASKILTKIAETNGVRPPADLTPRLQKIAEANKETSLGYLRYHK